MSGIHKKSSNETEKQPSQNQANFKVKFVSGLLGSTLSSFVCAPIDLVKVRLQVQSELSEKMYHGVFDAIKKIYEHEGIKGFYKGVKTALVTVPIFYSMYFPLYEFFKDYYSKYFYGDQGKFNVVVYSLAASTSAITCDIFTNPMWVVRIRYQTEFLHTKTHKIESFNLFKELKKLYHEEGIFAFYRGLGASFLGIPHVIIQFSLYESFKTHFSKNYNNDVNKIPYYLIFISSLISKSTASFCTYPHEVIRNSIQNVRNYHEKEMSMRKLLKNIYASQGINGFYAGFKLNLVRILPNNAVMFVCYEYLSRLLSKHI